MDSPQALVIAWADGIGLRVVLGPRCSLLLRRRDLRPESRFGRYFGQPIDAGTLSGFRPGWRTLKWKEAASGFRSRPEWLAFDGAFQVSLETQRGCGEEALRQFAGFMAGSAL
jgi:hypothetical protein